VRWGAQNAEYWVYATCLTCGEAFGTYAGYYWNPYALRDGRRDPDSHCPGCECDSCLWPPVGPHPSRVHTSDAGLLPMCPHCPKAAGHPDRCLNEADFKGLYVLDRSAPHGYRPVRERTS
jgi:hypothetical protein